MKIKTSELQDYKLDYYVAKCQGYTLNLYKTKNIWHVCLEYDTYPHSAYNPSKNWSLAGPIIEDNNISVVIDLYDGKYYYEATQRQIKDDNELDWKVWVTDENYVTGSTYLEAAMRCYVLSKLGEEVEDV